MHAFPPLLSALVGLLAAAGPAAASFADPEVEYRPKFRYWLPDASIPPATLRSDIATIAEAGAGGIQLLAYHQYGMPESDTSNTPPPTDWNLYGFGTPAFAAVFKAGLDASRDAGAIMDFAQGANQGQGVPAVPGTEGLAVELAYANVTVGAGETHDGVLPLSTQPVNVFPSFMHAAEEFGDQTLKRVVAAEVLDTDVLDLSSSGIAMTSNTFTVGEVVDLTERVGEDRRLTWTPPAGNSTWRVMAWYERHTNQRSCAGGVNATSFLGNGSWVVDHFSASGSKKLTDFLDEYVFPDAETRELVASVAKYAWEDSMEMQSSLWWTPTFFDRFEKARGYDITTCLPYLIKKTNYWNSGWTPYSDTFSAKNTTVGDKCNDDYHTTLNEGYQEYLGAYETWAHGLGIQYSAQPAYNLPMSMLDDVAILDAPEGESLGFSDMIDMYRQFSGPAHLANLSVISSECGALSGAPYQQTMNDLLWSVRRGLSAGISMHVLHGFAYSGEYTNTTWPSYTTFAYTFSEMWNQHQPSWIHMNDSLAYIARNQYVSQAGPPSVDLAFYHYSAPQAIESQYLDSNLETLGYTYEYLSAGNLQTPEAVVEGGILAPNGPSYKAMVFINQTLISAAGATKLQEFATAGFPVFFVGSTDFSSIGQAPGEVQNVTSTMKAILNSRLDNVHTVATSADLPDALSSAGILPKVSFSDATSWYPFWRRADGIDYAYIYNDGDSTQTVDVKFDTTGTPYHFDAWTGAINPVLQYTTTPTSLTIPITLAANQTTILGFAPANASSTSLPAAPSLHITSSSGAVIGFTSSTNGTPTAHLTGPASLTLSNGQTRNLTATPPPATNLSTWDIVIEDWQRTANHLSMDTSITRHNFSATPLAPWSHLDPTLVDASGLGHYTTSFNATSTTARLHLGPVTNSIRAWLNGNILPPIDLTNAVVDVSDYLQLGANRLQVEVSTTLFNRVRSYGNETWAVGVTANAENSAWYETHAPMTYGLLGPVSVEWVSVVDVV